VLNNHINYF